MIRIERCLIQKHKAFTDLVVHEHVSREEVVSLKALGTELKDYLGESLRILVLFHGPEGFRLLHEKRHQVRKVLDFGGKERHGLPLAIRS